MNRLAVIGTSRPAPSEDALMERAAAMGRALSARRFRVLTGACGGFPDAFAGGFREVGGHVTGFSPGQDLESHDGGPPETYDELRFGFGGLIQREVAMLEEAELVLCLGGNIGTLSELCMAVKMERRIVLADGFGGASSRFLDILGAMNVYPPARARRVACDDVPSALDA